MGRPPRKPPSTGPKRRPPPGPDSKRRQGERARAQARLLEAATSLFATRGIENVTIGEISRKARMSRPLVYFYFPDLRTLFLEAVHAAGTRLLTRLSQAMDQAGSGLEAIVAMGRAYVAFHREEPDAFQVCLANTGIHASGPNLTETETRLLNLERDIMERVVSAVTRGIQDGSVREDSGEPRMLALHLWAFVQGLVQLGSHHQITLERTYGVLPGPFLEAGFETLRHALARPAPHPG